MTEHYEILDKRFHDKVAVLFPPEELFNAGLFTEGPAYFPAGRFLLFTDLPNDRIMAKFGLRSSLASIAGLIVLVGGYLMSPETDGPRPAFAEANQVTFPPLDQLSHYTTVRRGITREHMLTSETALGAIKAGKNVPTGTHEPIRGGRPRYLYGDGADRR